MPTGYTAGILDGEITTFQQFAKQCARNFGATIHMRDDDLNKEYIKREPSDYHTKAIAEAEKLLVDSKTMSDEDLVSITRARLIKDREYHTKALETAKVNSERMGAMLKSAVEYVAPTPEHDGIRSFMIQQLRTTIDHDCNWSDGYHAGKLKEIEIALSSINAEDVRRDMAAKAYKDLAYHQKEHNADVKRCADANQWVDTFFKSIAP